MPKINQSVVYCIPEISTIFIFQAKNTIYPVLKAPVYRILKTMADPELYNVVSSCVVSNHGLIFVFLQCREGPLQLYLVKAGAASFQFVLQSRSVSQRLRFLHLFIERFVLSSTLRFLPLWFVFKLTLPDQSSESTVAYILLLLEISPFQRFPPFRDSPFQIFPLLDIPRFRDSPFQRFPLLEIPPLEIPPLEIPPFRDSPFRDSPFQRFRVLEIPLFRDSLFQRFPGAHSPF